MKYHYLTSTALLCSIMLGGCGVQNNHPARTQSYLSMGDQGYHIKSNPNGSSVQNMAGQATTYSLSRKKVSSNFNLYKSNQLEAKLNRAGVTGYRVLASDHMVFLALAYPDQQSGGGSPSAGSVTGLSSDKGFGTPHVPHIHSSDKGFGTSDAPQINDTSNQINGTPVDQLRSSKGTPGINKQITNPSNQVPVNPGVSNSSRVVESSTTNVYKARHIIEKELGADTAVQFVNDPAGVDAIAIIKQKLSTVGTPRPEPIQAEVATLENSINQ